MSVDAVTEIVWTAVDEDENEFVPIEIPSILKNATYVKIVAKVRDRCACDNIIHLVLSIKDMYPAEFRTSPSGDMYCVLVLAGYLDAIFVRTPNRLVRNVIEWIALAPVTAIEANVLSGGRSADEIGQVPYLLDGNILKNLATQETLRINIGRLGSLIYNDRIAASGFPGKTITQRRSDTGRVLEDSLRIQSTPIFFDDTVPISIVTPVYEVDPQWLRMLVTSIINQIHGSWKLILVDDGSSRIDLISYLNEVESLDDRISMVRRSQNGGISVATNDGLARVTTKYFALVDNDDILTPNALSECAKALKDNHSIDWIYTDEFYVDENNTVTGLFAKPDWSPFMLFNYMYTGHLSLYRTAMVRSIGGFRSDFDFSQDYDLALRLQELSPCVVHIDQYLYGWRMIPTSAAAGGKPTARLSNIAALQDALHRRNMNAVAIALPTANRAVFDLAPHNVLVSIVIPSDDIEHIRSSIASIIESSSYKNVEIIIVTNSTIVSQIESEQKEAFCKFCRYDKVYNFSDKCNAGARSANGQYIIFFNDDVRVVSPDWIEGIVEYLIQPNVGIVGPKLLYENGLIQHAGMMTGVRRFVGTAFHSLPADTNFHFNMAQCVREVSLICGALLAIRADVFWKIKGFDAVNTPIAHSDVDLCLRVQEIGYSCIYTPHVDLMHIGHVSIGREEGRQVMLEKPKDLSDLYIIDRFGPQLSRDPYFPPSMRDIAYPDSQENFRFYGCSARSYCSLERSVLIISHDLSNSGAPRVALDMARTMHEAGYFVVVTSPVDGPLRQKMVDCGIPVIVDSLLLENHEYFPKFARNFDKIICNTIVSWPVVSQVKNIARVYWYIHESELIKYLIDQYPEVSALLRSVHRLFAVSPHTGCVLTELNVSFELFETGVEDLGERWRPNVELNRVNIGLFGSFEPRKGQDILAHAFHLLPEQIRDKANLHFFGRRHDLNFEANVRALWDSTDNIHFHGEARHPDYFQRMADMDIVVCASRDDPLPLVLLDAMSMSKTIVCSRSSGTSAYLENGVSGFIAEKNTSEEHAEILNELIMYPEKRVSTRKGARRLYEEKFSKESFVKRIFERFELK